MTRWWTPLLTAFVVGCGSTATTPSSTSSQSNTTQVRVTAPIGLFAGDSAQAGATSSNADVSTLAAWQSSNTSVATISASGMVTTVAPGTTQLSATYQGGSGSDTLVVSRDSDLVSVQLQSCTGPLAIGQTADCVAIANIQGVAASTNVTSRASWSSSNANVLFVGAGGHLIGIAPGTATISATYRGKTASFGFLVIGPP